MKKKRIYKRNKLGQFAKTSLWLNLINSVFNKVTKEIAFKFVALLLIVDLNVVAISHIGYTQSYYNDIESSNSNIFTAASLAFSLNSSTDFTPEVTQDSPNTLRTISVSNDGGLGFQYTASTTNPSGALCLSLNLVAKLDEVEKYNGPLNNFNAGSFVFDETEDWNFDATLISNAPELEGTSCEFDFQFDGWQENLPLFPDGFHDIDIIHNKITFHDKELENHLGDVVINEIMWMGSFTESADEWIELRNTTTSAIDISGWKIIEAGSGAGASITIPSGNTIPANGFFLIGNYASNNSNSAVNDSIIVDYVTTGISLNNGGEQLTLKDVSEIVIDQTPSTSWAAGTNSGSTRKSMERNAVPSDGTVVTNWHTCIASGCNSITFWDVEDKNYGTPRATNLSDNDSSIVEEEVITDMQSSPEIMMDETEAQTEPIETALTNEDVGVPTESIEIFTEETPAVVEETPAIIEDTLIVPVTTE